jgi:hypothetical protein
MTVTKLSLRKKKTILRTIRLTEEVDDLLEKDAQKQTMSVNALISKIMTKYVEWDSHVEKLGYVSIANSMLKRLMDAVSDEGLEKIARDFSDDQRVRTIALWAFRKVSTETILQTISLVGKYGGVWLTDVKCDGECVITFHHALGAKGSTFTKYYVDSLVKNEFGTKPKIEATNDAVIVSFPIPLESRTGKVVSNRHST